MAAAGGENLIQLRTNNNTEQPTELSPPPNFRQTNFNGDFLQEY